MKTPILYSFKRCPYAMRARMAIKLSNINCELREIRLNNKPKHMLEVSPKGTVPVLVLEERIIDESMEIIHWAMNQKNIFNDDISRSDKTLTETLINDFDNKFKHHLDRYKYSTRYKDVDAKEHRNLCMQMLMQIECLISKENWFFSSQISKLDISILPFIRQFRIADTDWFDNQELIPKTQKFLNTFLNSDLFNDVMINYKLWVNDSEPIYFPAKLQVL